MSRWILVCLLFAAFAGGPAKSDELSHGQVDALVHVLEQQDLINEEQAAEIRSRKAEKAKRNWWERVTVSGDFRGRWEGAWYDDDPTGGDSPNVSRFRYRLRLKADVEINEQIDMVARITSGDGKRGPRTRNQTLGRGDDFDPDDLYIDLAYIDWHPLYDNPDHRLNIRFGKIPNWFRRHRGVDALLWDSDITLEGLSAQYGFSPCECLDLEFRGGIFQIEELTDSTSDPYLMSVQAEGKGHLSSQFDLAAQVSWYGYRSLNDDFYDRAEGGGNIVGGLSDTRRFDVGDVRVWLKWMPDANGNQFARNFPVSIWGNVLKNFTAQSIAGTHAGKADMGWSLGLTVGDKKRLGALGAGYFWIEANAVPANYTDSDVFDGATNRKGWTAYGSKELLTNTDFRFQVFWDDALDDDIDNPVMGAFPSLENSDRVRVRTDVVVKF